MHTDEMTAKKRKLEYARILVKVEVGKELPKSIPIRSVLSDKVIIQEIMSGCLYCARSVIHGGIQKGIAKKYTKVKKPVVDKGKEQVLVDEQTQAAPVHIETGECSKQSPVVSQTPHHTVVSSKERDRKKEWTEVKNSQPHWTGTKTPMAVQHALTNLFQVLSQAGVNVESGLDPNPGPPDPCI